MLILVKIAGVTVNGAQRWINLGPMSLQPSEFAKISVILFFSYSISKRQNELKKFKSGLMPYLMVYIQLL